MTAAPYPSGDAAIEAIEASLIRSLRVTLSLRPGGGRYSGRRRRHARELIAQIRALRELHLRATEEYPFK